MDGPIFKLKKSKTFRILTRIQRKYHTSPGSKSGYQNWILIQQKWAESLDPDPQHCYNSTFCYIHFIIPHNQLLKITTDNETTDTFPEQHTADLE